ncbi:MAG: heparan-alpha-glucosaminide N-acetyltransferase domain-containing protein [Pseudomonadota bacterium]
MTKAARLPAIDMLRGFVIVLMALDHVRDFFGFTPFQPEDLAQTTPAWFWTRWITHLCATTFVLVAGSSAFLRGRGAGIPALSRYLATRGAMLLLLEATWISFSWQFAYDVMILQVLWALGAGMIALSLLVWLPRPVIALIAVLLIVPHNALDGYTGGLLWRAWHQGGYFPLSQQFGIVFMYPLMPWLGLIAAGYALGPVFLWERARRQRFLLAAAFLLMLAFVALRSFNLYGDPHPWSPQGRGAMFDLMSFARVHKYPPSLLYLCVTGSIGLLLLALFERMREVKLLSLFGRTPMFFYVVHIALAHFLGNLYFTLRFGGTPDFSNGQAVMPAGYEPSLPVVYAAWAGLLVLMYLLTILWLRWRARGAIARTAAAH